MNFETKPTENTTFNNEIQFESVLNKAFLNYKKIALYAGLALFVFFFIFILFFTALSINFIDPKSINEKSAEYFQKLLLTKPYIWYYSGFSILMASILSPFMAGFYKMADAAEKDVSFGVSNLFSLYTSRYFPLLFGATFIITLASTSASLIFEELNIPFLGILLELGINFFTILTIPLIVLSNQGILKSIKTSISISLRQPLIIFLLLFIALIGVLLGFFAFCIGVFFTYPFMISVVYSIHNEVSTIKYN